MSKRLILRSMFCGINTIPKFLSLFAIFAISGCCGASASTILVSTSGQFSSTGVISDNLAAPGENWTLSFELSNTPAVYSSDSAGFDVPFSDFEYSLNGSAVAMTPSFIHFYTSTNDGLFTVFFGPESGFSGGQPIPEISFEGSQLFSGTTSDPAITTGSYITSDWTYSDALDYDDHPSGGTIVSLVAVPEPEAFALSLLALGFFGLILARRSRRSLLLGIVGATLLTQTSGIAQTPDNTTLKFALVFSRHGVRSPTKTNDAYQPYAVSPWPSWSVAPGYLTTNGAQLMTLMGSYYHQYFVQQGLLTGDDRRDVRKVYFYSDNAERTYATGRALAGGMFTTVPTQVNEYTPTTASDPLFYPVKDNIGSPDVNLAAAALSGRIGNNPAAFQQGYTLQFALLESALLNQPITTDPTLAPTGLTSVAAMPLSVTPGSGGSIVGFNGGVDTASTLTEIFLLEYCDGKAASDLAWGRLTEQQIQQVNTLHTIDFDLTDRTPYLAQTQGSNLLQHIRNTLNQAATGTAATQSLGQPYDSLVMLIGHDNQLAAVGGLMDADWQLPGFALDDTPPGGAFVFELRQNPDSSLIVRIYYVCQTMDQMHNMTPLTLANGPATAPIFIPGASTNTPFYDCPLDDFNAMVDRVINLQYTN